MEKSNGVWSEIFLFKACTVVCGYLDSKSVQTSILSNFFKGKMRKDCLWRKVMVCGPKFSCSKHVQWYVGT